MTLVDNGLVALCVGSCFLSAWVMHGMGTPRLSRQRGHQIAGWQMVVTGSIAVYFMLKAWMAA